MIPSPDNIARWSACSIFPTAAPVHNASRYRASAATPSRAPEGIAGPGLCRVAAAADFGNGISAVLSPLDGYVFINPDLTIYLHRLPVSEWVCLDADTRVQPHGVGAADSQIYDERGPIGRSVQSLLVEKL